MGEEHWLTVKSLTAGVINTAKPEKEKKSTMKRGNYGNLMEIPFCARGKTGKQEYEQTKKEIYTQELGIKGRNVYGCFG